MKLKRLCNLYRTELIKSRLKTMISLEENLIKSLDFFVLKSVTLSAYLSGYDNRDNTLLSRTSNN